MLSLYCDKYKQMLGFCIMYSYVSLPLWLCEHITDIMCVFIRAMLAIVDNLDYLRCSYLFT